MILKFTTVLFFSVVLSASAQTAPCSELFISKYVCATGANKAIEIYNPTAAPVLLTGTYRLTMYENGAVSPSVTRNLIGTVQPYSTFVLANGQVTADTVHPITGPMYLTPPCDTALQRVASQLDSAHFYAFSYFNGDDALSLEKYSAGSFVPVDIFATIGEWPVSAGGTHVGWWNTAPFNNATIGHSWTKFHTLQRKASVVQGVTLNPSPGTWDVSAEYDSLPNSVTGKAPQYYPNGSHTCDCATITGVRERSAPGIELFPNPVRNGLLSVRSSRAISDVQIFNALGQVLPAEKTGVSSFQLTLDLVHNPAGLYFARILLDTQEVLLRKVIVE